MKNKWNKPCLQILSRSKEEEMVLSACKFFTPGGGEGANADNSGCWLTTCNTACQQTTYS